MSSETSDGAGKIYGLARVCRVLEFPRSERVNDFATPCLINLRCKLVFCQGSEFPLTEG
jgi:hypothetical protein